MTPRYNCVAHAVHEDLLSYWPDDDNRWPTGIIREENVAAFVEFFKAAGFLEIQPNDASVDQGFEKVALFADGGEPRHVARQLESGRWTSKLGVLADIEHRDLPSMEGGQYGYVVKIMRRRQTGQKPQLPDPIPGRPLIIIP